MSESGSLILDRDEDDSATLEIESVEVDNLNLAESIQSEKNSCQFPAVKKARVIAGQDSGLNSNGKTKTPSAISKIAEPVSVRDDHNSSQKCPSFAIHQTSMFPHVSKMYNSYLK